ncbi:MAG: hypothetical protein ACMG6E_06605 [Candidatus Roizmanbacteria bacterium]
MSYTDVVRRNPADFPATFKQLTGDSLRCDCCQGIFDAAKTKMWKWTPRDSPSCFDSAVRYIHCEICYQVCGVNSICKRPKLDQ